MTSSLYNPNLYPFTTPLPYHHFFLPQCNQCKKNESAGSYLPKFFINRIFYVNVKNVDINLWQECLNQFKQNIFASEQENCATSILRKQGLWEDLFFPTTETETRIELHKVEINQLDLINEHSNEK